MLTLLIGLDVPSLVGIGPSTPLERAWGALGSGLDSTLGLLLGEH
jgi:hypothetical protein